jgi:arylformamidase
LKDSEVEVFDISRTLCEGMPVWPGDPQFHRRRIAQMRDRAPSNVSAFDMGVHTGTHVDAPLHLDELGRDIAHMPMLHFLGPARIFSLPVKECIRATDISSLDWSGVKRVLFKTQHCDLPESLFEKNFIYFQGDAAEFLVEQRILLVGIDSPSVDAFDSLELPSHRILLGHGIMILENAQLGSVPPGNYELICLPLKLSGLDGSPVRAVLRK